MPPCSRITSGTAREQIRLYRIGRARVRAQHGGGQDRGGGRSADAAALSRRRRTRGRRRRRTRARCRSHRRSTRACRSRWFAGCSGSAGWFGNVPSSSPYITSSSISGRRSNTAGTTRPPMPLAVSATTRSGRTPSGSTNDTTWSANARSRLRSLRVAGRGGGRRAVPSSTARRSPGSRPSPVSMPTGRAPGEAQLDAVVLRRVVRRGEHRAGRVEASRPRSTGGRSTRARCG